MSKRKSIGMEKSLAAGEVTSAISNKWTPVLGFPFDPNLFNVGWPKGVGSAGRPCGPELGPSHIPPTSSLGILGLAYECNFDTITHLGEEDAG